MKIVKINQLASIIGQPLDNTDWHTVDQAQINAFADCTLDHQYIHVNPELAKDSPFGSTIAHGFLSLSMLSHFAESFSAVLEGMYMGVNYGFDKIRFITPVKVGSRIRANATLLNVVEKNPGQFMLTTDVEIEIEGSDKPALKAQWLSMQMVK